MVFEHRLHLTVARHPETLSRFEPDHRPGIAQGIMVRIGIGQKGFVERIKGERRDRHAAKALPCRDCTPCGFIWFLWNWPPFMIAVRRDLS